MDDIVQGTTVAQTQEALIKISKACNFMAVFQNMLGQEHVDQGTWQSLLELLLRKQTGDNQTDVLIGNGFIQGDKDGF